jgi:hypothetical protein
VIGYRLVGRRLHLAVPTPGPDRVTIPAHAEPMGLSVKPWEECEAQDPGSKRLHRRSGKEHIVAVAIVT